MLINEMITFFMFVLYGVIIAVIYDFFRAIRVVYPGQIKRLVLIQDIVYIFISAIILLVFIYNYIKEDIRIHLILSSFLGIIIYYSILGNVIRDIFKIIICVYKEILYFIFIPFKIYKELYNLFLKKITNYVKKCCKKNIYMINLNYTKVISHIKEKYKREVIAWKTKFQKKKRIKNSRQRSIG